MTLTEHEFNELREYAEGYATDRGYKPPASLVRRGFLERVVDNFYAITDSGRDVLQAMRQGRAA
jgi:hypothetical protein